MVAAIEIGINYTRCMLSLNEDNAGHGKETKNLIVWESQDGRVTKLTSDAIFGQNKKLIKFGNIYVENQCKSNGSPEYEFRKFKHDLMKKMVSFLMILICYLCLFVEKKTFKFTNYTYLIDLKLCK